MKNILVLIAMIVGVISCEKVIEIPLNEADKKVVIEGVCNDRPGESKVLLSKTGSVYEQSVFDKINDAVVTITDKDGVVTTFLEDGTSEGVYVHPTFATEPNQIYNLSVTIGSEVFTAKSVTKTYVPLEGLYYEKGPPSPFSSSEQDSVYLVFFAFNDNALDENFYRIKVSTNGNLEPDLYITDDKLTNGEQFVQPLFFNEFNEGDTCFVEFFNMDKANYTYVTSKASASDGSATPANPVTNIEGGALGYFGAFLTDTVTILLP